MEGTIQWLSNNQVAIAAASTVVTTVATVVLAITTIVYAIFTRNLVTENRLLRKSGSAPEVVAYITTNPHVFQGIDFVLMNIGQGPAVNIRYEFIGGEDFAHHQVSLKRHQNRLTLLPQNEAIRTSLGLGFNLLEPPALAPFSVKIDYETVTGEPCHGEFAIDVGTLGDLGRIGTPPLDRIAKALESIAIDSKPVKPGAQANRRMIDVGMKAKGNT